MITKNDGETMTVRYKPMIPYEKSGTMRKTGKYTVIESIHGSDSMLVSGISVLDPYMNVILEFLIPNLYGTHNLAVVLSEAKIDEWIALFERDYTP